MLLSGATVVEFAPASAEVTTLRIQDGVIASRGSELTLQPGDELIDLSGKVIMPGLVSAHHHMFTSWLRGGPKVRDGWAHAAYAVDRLAQALDERGVELATRLGAAEALRSGTTTVFDSHFSPQAGEGALMTVAEAVAAVGGRGVLGYQATDKFGPEVLESAFSQTRALAQKARGRIRAMVAADSVHHLSPQTLLRLREAAMELQVFFQCTLGEDPNEERHSIAQYGMSSCDRLAAAGLLGGQAIYAQAVQLSWPELSTLLDSGAWLVHCPRSNMAQQAGTAASAKFGPHACLGTDTCTPDVFAEAQAAFLKARDTGQSVDTLHWLANGHRLASLAFDAVIGPMRAGAAADLLVLDYQPGTPINAENIDQHVVQGLLSGSVESVMVDGVWRMWKRRLLGIDVDAVHAKAQEIAKVAWAQM